MKACKWCGIVGRDAVGDPDEWLRCGCFWPDPRTYWTCIVPYTEGPTRTQWHPTDRNFAPLSRGFFTTQARAHEWAAENMPGAEYTLKEYPRGDIREVRFDSVSFKAAIDKYLGIFRTGKHTQVILSDACRQQVAEWLHDNHPLWIAQFSMDLVEWVLSTYHGAKSE